MTIGRCVVFRGGFENFENHGETLDVPLQIESKFPTTQQIFRLLEECRGAGWPLGAGFESVEGELKVAHQAWDFSLWSP